MTSPMFKVLYQDDSFPTKQTVISWISEEILEHENVKYVM